MSAITLPATTDAVAAEMIAAVRNCFPVDSIDSATEGIINLQVDPYGDRLVKVEASFGTATISLIHPELGSVAWASHTYREGEADRLTDAVFAFLKGVFNYGWM
ncbi:hypothetical protein [Kitasatospora cineracea]|uniref:hypothetical protein n=1 Tax=Kitasatospora cineracea TaxID=88074 RepID=UPI0033C44E18